MARRKRKTGANRDKGQPGAAPEAPTAEDQAAAPPEQPARPEDEEQAAPEGKPAGLRDTSAAPEQEPSGTMASSPSPLQAQLADDLRARRRTENQLKVTFFVSLLVGLTAGGFGNWQIPTIAVCAYAVIGWRITRHEENIERFADSLYYMGFLFTIWGLLFAFGPWIASRNLSSTTIITQFGIKLITTVVALTARIVLLQVRSSLAEETEEARETLGAMAKAMIREMEQSVQELQDARNRILAQAQEDASRVHGTAMRELSAFHEEIRQQSQAMLESYAGSLNTLIAQIEAISVPADILAAPLDAAAKDLAAESSRLQAALRESGAGIGRVLAESLERAQESSARVNTALAGFEGFDQLVKETNAAVATMANAGATLEATYRQTNVFLEELTRVIAALQQAASTDVSRVRETLKTTAEEIEKLRETVRKDSESFTAALTDGIRTLRQEVERR